MKRNDLLLEFLWMVVSAVLGVVVSVAIVRFLVGIA